MKSLLLGLVKIGSNYYSFLSGVFIAVSVNLYTGVFSGDRIPVRWSIILMSSLLTFVSAFFWILVSWKFDAIQKLVLSESPKGIQPEEAYRALFAGKEVLYTAYFLLAVLSAILGLAVLVLGYL